MFVRKIFQAPAPLRESVLRDKKEQEAQSSSVLPDWAGCHPIVILFDRLELHINVLGR